MKGFDLADVLSITTSRLVSPRHMEGVYDILNYMTGESLYTHQLPKACEVCTPYLLNQYPALGGEWIKEAVNGLVAGLENSHTSDQRKAFIIGWLNPLYARFGRALEVIPMPEGQWALLHSRGPLEDLQEMVPPEKIIVIEQGGGN